MWPSVLDSRRDQGEVDPRVRGTDWASGEGFVFGGSSLVSGGSSWGELNVRSGRGPAEIVFQGPCFPSSDRTRFSNSSTVARMDFRALGASRLGIVQSILYF